MNTKCVSASHDSLDSIVEHPLVKQTFPQAVIAEGAPQTLSTPPWSAVPRTEAPGRVPQTVSDPRSASSAKPPQASDHSNNGLFKAQPPSTMNSFHGMAGRSPAIRRFFSQIQTTAPYLRIATLEGEDGTGKTLAARTLHLLGPFAKSPFIPCLAQVFLADEHSFGPLPWCPLLLAQAAGGMLFLDRVDDLTQQQQARLFQFLIWFEHQQERKTNRSLGSQTGPPAPRQLVVSSANSLRRLAASDAVRGDLCSRLTAIRLLLPPLRERREDIPLLAQVFVQRFSQTFRKPIRGLAPEALSPLLRYAWPGNVRELESVISSAALQTESQWIRSIDLPPLTAPTTPEALLAESDFNLDRVIARHIQRTLERTRGNKLRAASILGISRSTLYRILGSH